MQISNFKELYNSFIESLFSNIDYYLTNYWADIFWAVIILALWVVVSILMYRFTRMLLVKFNIIKLLEKFELNIDKEHEKTVWKDAKKTEVKVKKPSIFKNQLKIDHVIAKAVSYYVFLLFFRWAVVKIGITEIEQFLKDVLYYLPSLFIGILIGYFGTRFAGFVYDVTYHTLHLARQKTARIIASWAKIIILFFTLMVVLNYTKIVDEFIINTILVGFISMLTIAGWLAFGIGWKDIAKEILESFRK